jgi:hypothetical protein
MAYKNRKRSYGVMDSTDQSADCEHERRLDERSRRRIGAEIVDAYRRQPQTDEELAGLDRATRNLIEAEPW